MRTFFCWSSWIYSFNVLEHYDAVVGWVFPVAPLATTSRLLRDTSQLIRDVMDRSLLAQRTDSAQPSPTSINGTLVNPEKSQMPWRGSNTRLVLLKWNTHPDEPASTTNARLRYHGCFYFYLPPRFNADSINVYIKTICM